MDDAHAFINQGSFVRHFSREAPQNTSLIEINSKDNGQIQKNSYAK